MPRNPLESPDSRAGTASSPAPLAGEAWGGEPAEADADLISEREAVLAGLARQGPELSGRGTEMRCNPLKSPDSGAEAAPMP